MDEKIQEFKTNQYRIISLFLIIFTLIFGAAQGVLFKFISSNEKTIETIEYDVRDLEQKWYIQSNKLSEFSVDIRYIKKILEKLDKKLDDKDIRHGQNGQNYKRR